MHLGEDFVVIGTLVRTTGLRGAVIVAPASRCVERFDALKRVYLRTPSGAVHAASPDRVVRGGRTLRIHFQGMDQVEDVQDLVGAEICVPESERWPLPEGNYYHSDLIGMNVLLEDGTPLGRLEDILEAPANDVFIVRREDREFLIPAVRSIVVGVDVAGKTLRVRSIEGLLDGYAV